MGFGLKSHGFANGLGVGSKWVNWVWDTRVMGYEIIGLIGMDKNQGKGNITNTTTI